MGINGCGGKPENSRETSSIVRTVGIPNAYTQYARKRALVEDSRLERPRLPLELKGFYQLDSGQFCTQPDKGISEVGTARNQSWRYVATL